MEHVKFVECLIFQGSVHKGDCQLCLDVSQVKPFFIQPGSHDMGIPFWEVPCVEDPVSLRKLPDKSNELVILDLSLIL